MKRLVLILLTAVSLVSCRKWVLEYRTPCPSYLFFDIRNRNILSDSDAVFTAVYSQPGGIFLDDGTATAGQIRDRAFFFLIKNTPAVRGYGLVGNASLIREGSLWRCPSGRDYAPLFRFQYSEAVGVESFTVPVEFVKDYCHVTVRFIGFEGFQTHDGTFPFDIVIHGNTNGIDALDGEPLRGPYEFAPKEGTTAGQFEFNIPRLADTSLSMELHGREGILDESGLVRSIDLFEKIRQNGGVDWKQKNLPDMVLEIDFVRWEVSVTIDAWEQKNLFYEY